MQNETKQNEKIKHLKYKIKSVEKEWKEAKKKITKPLHSMLASTSIFLLLLF
jgi:phage-related tail protein